jgi:hypothetical protein
MLVFQTKFAQAVRLIERLAGVFVAVPILVVTDSWFGNQGLLKPLRAALGPRVQLLSRACGSTPCSMNSRARHAGPAGATAQVRAAVGQRRPPGRDPAGRGPR